jgi:hypothetical protein
MSNMFGYTPFNQPLSGWNVSKVTNMSSMFRDSLFNQPIGNWDISGVTNFSNFMLNKTPVTFSSSNLNNIYNGWVTKNPKTSITISFGSAKYTAAGQSSRNILTGPPYNWLISDGGVI